ncbi:Possible phosphatase [hydrothermal vent metagenome]|uniref:Possible phosphatase n=1 Tax=hydrothermal vent metagenome TaxID=652676 RepID=A0A1W1BNR9_9ZZZZ
MSKNIIAIDLGSNSIRFLKMDCNTKQPINTFHKMVKTADGLAITGRISYPALDRIIVAINEAKEQMNFSDAKVKAVTTEAIRQAINGQEILDGIARNTGVEFEIIDGDDEARYALIATKNRLELLGESPKSFMIADIGGGSTELIFSYGDEMISKSFKIGIVTLTQSFKGIGEIANAIPALMNEMRLFCNEVYSKYGKVEKFIAMAGTPTTIASIKLGMTYRTYNAQKIHGTILTKADLLEQLKALLSMSVEQRSKMVGVGREDLIASGILIYEEIFNIGGFDSSIVIDDGVREGVALLEC